VGEFLVQSERLPQSDEHTHDGDVDLDGRANYAALPTVWRCPPA
jgi:hypothetical protein